MSEIRETRESIKPILTETPLKPRTPEGMRAIQGPTEPEVTDTNEGVPSPAPFNAKPTTRPGLSATGRASMRGETS